MGANAIYFLSKGQCASKNIYINRVPTCCKMTDLQQECFEAHECTNAMWICDVKKNKSVRYYPHEKETINWLFVTTTTGRSVQI